ncbi:MAG TPA: glycosyltransferase family 39 protein, partial [Pseudomonadales bacterium]
MIYATIVDRIARDVMYQRVALALIVLLALAIRLTMTARFVGLDTPPDADAGGLDVVDYEGLAWRTVSGQGYVLLETGEPTARRSPGTSFALMPIYLLFGHSYLAAHVWFCLLSALTCAALYTFGRAAGHAGIGLVAALFLALYPPHAYLSMHFFSETPFALAVTAACAATLLAMKNNDAKWAVVAGIAWGFAHLTRPMIIMCIPAGMLAFACIREWHTRVGVRQAALILFTALLIVTPWIVRNANEVGAASVSTLVGGYTFWGANNTLVLTDPELSGLWLFDERPMEDHPPLV